MGSCPIFAEVAGFFSKLIRGSFRKTALCAQRAEHFIGADVMQAKVFLALTGEVVVMRPYGLQQVEGPCDIALDECAGPIDRAVHVAFGCKVHHQIGIRRLHRLANGCGNREVHLLQHMALLCSISEPAQHLLNRSEVAGIAHLVEIEHDGVAFTQQASHHRTADEADSTGDEHSPAGSQQLSSIWHGVGHHCQEFVGIACSTSLRAARQGWACSCNTWRLPWQSSSE